MKASFRGSLRSHLKDRGSGSLRSHLKDRGLEGRASKPLSKPPGERLKALLTRPKLHGILHAGVTVRDFEAAVAWWHDVFGCYLVSEDTLAGEAADGLAALYGRTGLSIRMGFLRAPDGSVLELFQFSPPGEEQQADWTRPGYTHIALSVRNVPAWVERLRSRGIDFITPEPQFIGGAHWVFFRDPDGNLIELIDLHANRLPLKYLGGLVGRANSRGKWAAYYR